MTDWVADLSEIVDDLYNTKWDERDGRVVPDYDDVALKDGAVKLDAVFLYADLAGSSRLAEHCPWQTTAKIIRAYLDTATRLIRAYDGYIRSFDGDRVMGVFIGDNRETRSTYCGREIDYVVEHIIGPKATSQFKSVANNNIKIKHCVGIDSGPSHAVRTGIRNSNDLIWIGKAPSFSAKLSDVRTYPHTVYASSRVFSKISSEAKKSGGSDIWEAASFNFAGATETVYRTSYPKTP